MKKLLALLLVLASVFCLASCLGGETPEQPDDPTDEPTGELFVYSEVQGGYAISGLTDEGKTAKTLTIPTEYNGEKVIVIAANAFSGAAVEKLVLTEDTNIGKFENNAVAGASKLSAIYIYQPAAENILPPENFTGAAADLTIYVPEGSYYDTDYFWSQVPDIADMIEFMGA